MAWIMCAQPGAYLLLGDAFCDAPCDIKAQTANG
jgi:hypothetical protein